MNKTQGLGMQGLSRAKLQAVLDIGLVAGRTFATQNLHAAIALIGKQRMADVLHVSTNLMRTSRLQTAFH